MSDAIPTAPEEGPILAALRDVGYEVGSLAILRESRVRYREAIPILVAALGQTSDKKTLEEIVRALSVPWANPMAVKPLIELFRREHDPSGFALGWTVGSALEVIWNDEYFDDLVGLVRDRTYGRNRQMVALGFAKSKRPEAAEVLVGLLDDSDVNGHALTALRKLKAPVPSSDLERLLTDKRVWVRKEARRISDAQK